VISEGLDLVGGLGLQIKADPRQRQRQGIGEIVAGVGDQSQRVRPDSRHYLEHYERASD
jgi:hypothetical protein